MKSDVATLGVVEMAAALEARDVTSVDLVCASLNRIGFFDRTGPCINAVPVLNPDALEEARASDDRRAAGETRGPLDGVPFTVKDSFKVGGLTVASGSPAFVDLIADEDAATVALLRRQGAVLVGKTNMPPMAAGGVQPGVYGYARSPYHPGFLSAAFGSGSSNGAGAATAAGFAAFGLAEETLSSGRSPASNNGLVAYTPSRGLIPITGNWALFPTCDVVVPYARSVQDLLLVLDALVADWETTDGDFWRSQDVVALPAPASVRPPSFRRPRRPNLHGLRLGVPRMFLGDDPEKANAVAIRPSVKALWQRTEQELTRLGAEVLHVDFPVVSNYEGDRPSARGLVERDLVHPDWFDTEMGVIIARAWEDFLRANGMPGLSTLADVDGDLIFPDQPARVYANARTAFDYTRLVELVKAGDVPTWQEAPGYSQSVQGLEQARRDDFESWLERHDLDAVVFPANGDVARADLFERAESYDDALRNGVLFSNGNRAIRHLGIPTVTLPMGHMSDVGMPVGMTIAGPAYSDDFLLDIAAAFEGACPPIGRPPLTPSVPSGSVPRRQPASDLPETRDARTPWITTQAALGGTTVQVVVHDPDAMADSVEAWADGQMLVGVDRSGTRLFDVVTSPHRPRVGTRTLVVVRWCERSGRVGGAFVDVTAGP